MKYCLLFLLFLSNLSAELSDYFKKIEIDHTKKKPLKEIDYIYLINLDQRPEKLDHVLAKLEPYGIFPFRLPAVYGWDLSAESINDIGLTYHPKMEKNQWVLHYPTEQNGLPEFEFLRKDIHGKTCYSKWMTPGAIGCTLSHLSAIQNAYDAGFKTIWILEDNITVEKDPNQLSEIVKKLDKLVGKKNWDVLYTDGLDLVFNEQELRENPWALSRPDFDLSHNEKFAKRKVLNEDFEQIGSRKGAYSMIIRRSGMKKILNFEKKHRPFLPFDREIAFIPGINLINLRYNIITSSSTSSDTQADNFSKRVQWKGYKEQAIELLTKISGWRNPSRASKIMDFVKSKKPQVVVEIGAFGGAMSYPISKALAFNNQGVLYSIDAWEADEAVKGLSNEKDIKWWKEINFPAIYQSFQNLLYTTKLENYCRPIPKTSQKAVTKFSDESIDILVIDGNSSIEGSLSDVELYLPKVKQGGYIWLTDAAAAEKHPAILRLLEECNWIKEDSLGSSFALFQKSKSTKK